MTQWHIWAMKAGRFEIIKSYLENDVDEVVSILYPRVKKEYVSQNRVQIKTVPLYMNYIFVELKDNTFDDVFYKFKKYPFITTYVGPCSAKDLEEIERMKQKERDLSNAPQFFKDDKVIIIGGPLKGHKAKVLNVKDESSKASLEIPIFGRATVMDGIDLELLELEE